MEILWVNSLNQNYCAVLRSFVCIAHRATSLVVSWKRNDYKFQFKVQTIQLLALIPVHLLQTGFNKLELLGPTSSLS